MRLEITKPTRAVFAGLAVVASLAAYASNPVPDEKVAVAISSVQRAEQSGAPEAAPVQLAAARDKLAQAQIAVKRHDGRIAAQLADEASIDAQLAEAIAVEQKSRKAATEFDASMQTLRQETQRAGTRTN